MNKHAKTLRAIIVLLPAEARQNYGPQISAAADEIERLNIDFTRYQWLRARDINTVNQGGIFAGQTPQNIVINGEDLDKAIDQAIAKEVIQK